MKCKKTIFLIICSLFFLQIVNALELNVKIPDKYLEISPGDELRFQVEIKNIEWAGRQDISLEYIAKKDGSILTKSKELKAVETQASFLGSIKIPESADSGRYDLEVVINKEKSAEASFEVKRKNYFTLMNFLILVGLSILVISLIILWEIHKILKKGR